MVKFIVKLFISILVFSPTSNSSTQNSESNERITEKINNTVGKYITTCKKNFLNGKYHYPITPESTI